MAKAEHLKINVLYSVTFQVLEIILPLLTAPYLSRVLGADCLGLFSKSQALGQYFFLFCMLGVKNYGNRAIARVRDNRYVRSKTFWEIYGFQFLVALLFYGLYWAACFTYVTENRWIYMIQSLYVLSGVVNVNWFCFGMEKFKLTTMRSAAIRILSAVCIFVFIKDQSDLGLYTFIISFGLVLSNLIVWPLVVRHADFVRPTWKGMKPHIKPNLLLFWPVLAVSIYNVMDKLMLGYFSPDAEVAFYANAERIITVPTTIILALDNVVMPRMSNLFARDNTEKKVKFLMDTVMLFAMFMAAAMAFGMAGISDVFAPWFYGKEFVRCGYFLMLLSPVIVFKGWAGALRTQFIIPTGRDKIYVFSLTAGAIINLILNLILIPRINGVGAIIGTLAAEFAVCFIQFFLCRKEIDIKQYLINGFSFCGIGAIMFFVVESLSHVSSSALLTLIVQILCGGLFYLLLGSFYMIKIRKNPVLVNEALKTLKIKYRFHS